MKIKDAQLMLGPKKPCSMCDGTRELRYHANDPAWETDRRSVEHLRDEPNGDHIIQCPNHKALEAAP